MNAWTVALAAGAALFIPWTLAATAALDTAAIESATGDGSRVKTRTVPLVQQG
jgi:hypothetical protein